MNPWYLITLTGQPEVWLAFTGVLALVYLFFRKRLNNEKIENVRKGFFVLIVSVWLTTGIVFGLKNLVNVQRPCTPCEGAVEECNPYCLLDNSFPSGHSAVIFAVFTSLYITAKKKELTIMFAVPFLVAVSRYFLVVHYMTDVITGSIIGVLVPIAVLLFYEKKFGH